MGSAAYIPHLLELEYAAAAREGKATMAWQEVFPLNVSRIDAEEERELRLASQARAGAEWALSALVARYQPPVTRYLTRLTGDARTARVLAERIFVRMEKRLHGPHAGEHLRLWLLRACTEAGLDALRHPQGHRAALRLDGPRMAGLLPERAGEAAAGRLRAGLGALANLTGSTSRQVRQLIWSTEADAPQHKPKPAPLPPHAPERTKGNGRGKASQQRTPPISIAIEEDPAQQDPREALRFRMVRAVLAEIPYGDAQCLALHLIAGLNQAEVAQALGITHSATRRRIVQGLQLFAQRYEAAAASLGLSLEALSLGAGRTSPPAEAALPPERAATSAAPLPEAATDAFSPAPLEEPQTAPVVWETPFMVMPRATAAPVTVPLPESSYAAAVVGSRAGDEDATFILDERGGAAVNPDEEKTLVIVETTAVVDATPLAELPLMDTAILLAPEERARDDTVALELAAVEVAALPPEPAAPVEYAPDAPFMESKAELAALEEESEMAARYVPVLSPVNTVLPEVPEVRVVPVLTSAAPASMEHETVAAPGDNEVTGTTAVQAASAVRMVPVLTPTTAGALVTDTTLAEPDALPGERRRLDDELAAALAAGDGVDMPELRETVVLPVGAHDAAVEAQIETQVEAQ